MYTVTIARERASRPKYVDDEGTIQVAAALRRSGAMCDDPPTGPPLYPQERLLAVATLLVRSGHVFAKTGTTIEKTGLKAQVLAGYIDTRSGRHLAFALYVKNAGPIENIADVANVFSDEAMLTNVIYLPAP